ncbi:MAG: serine/threonine-protein kinase [Cyanobacteriota bacterium]|nr:serine/threonine-protein kinase [Cyanobacteriota bacterium]
MTYCINPDCPHPLNPDTETTCQACGTSLIVEGRYRPIEPLRPLNSRFDREVFEVDDRGTRKVMKILRDDRHEAIERFEREALTLQLLNHPGIPQVDLDGYFPFIPNASSRTLYCLVMEKIEGLNLEQWLMQNGVISQGLALVWLKQLIQMLDVLHGENFFHRDIKPANIICRPDGRLALIDFGAVREMSDTYMAKLKRFEGLKTDVPQITAVLSAGYTPQEQMDGKALPQSDFFALGRTFVHLLTGKHPSELPVHPKTGQLIWRNFAPQISYPLADFIDMLMAALPYHRPQSTQWLLENLTPWRLRLQSLGHFLNSPKFKLSAVSLLTLTFIYRLSFPWQAEYFYNRGIEALEKEQLDRARDYNERALRFAPQSSKIHNNLGFVCQKQNDRDCAEAAYETALELEENPVTLYNLGGLYDDSGDFDRAAANYEKAIAFNRSVSVNATSDLARLHVLQGETDRAIELSLQGLDEVEQYEGKENVTSALHKNLGWAYWVQGENREAAERLQEAISLNENRTDAYCLLAMVRETQGEEALELWRDCRDGDSRDQVEIKTWQTIARQRVSEVGE